MLVRNPRPIKRADEAVVDATPVEGALVAISKPKMLSMVGLPANQTGFKIVRSDTEGAPKMRTPLLRRTKRSEEPGPILQLTFPPDANEEFVEAALKNYGLSGYRIEKTENTIVAIRADLKSISNDTTMAIKLNEEGLTATIARMADATPAVGEKAALTVAHMNFDAAKYTLEDVKRWVAEKCVDGTVEEPQNPDECYVVRRSAVPEGEETRQMALEDGITAVIVRSDVASIPDGFVAVVNEAAYGNWGWGQLDFAAAMADQEFSVAMEDSIYMLKSILLDIVIWSRLSLDMRKELANRALAQFGEYVGTVMDSLPRQLLVSVVRSAKPNQENLMTTAASGAATPEAKPIEVQKADSPLTRAEVTEMIRSGVIEGVKAAFEAAKPAGVELTAAPAAVAAVAAPASETLSRSDIKAIMEEVMKPVTERVESLAGQTLVRSQQESSPPASKEGESKEKTTDVFRGAFSGLRGKATA